MSVVLVLTSEWKWIRHFLVSELFNDLVFIIHACKICWPRDLYLLTNCYLSAEWSPCSLGFE
jgi:hypothetical protein